MVLRMMKAMMLPEDCIGGARQMIVAETLPFWPHMTPKTAAFQQNEILYRG